MIRLEFFDDGATITLDRGAARNAVPIAGWEAIANAAREAGERQARFLILKSAMPRMFSAGADLAEFQELIEDAVLRRDFRIAMASAVEALAALPMPVIAAVDGGCYGGAVALVLACDMIVAGDAAIFATTPAKLGLSYPPIDVTRLRERVGPGQAARMFLTAEAMLADEALRIGLVDLRAANGEAKARELVQMILANEPHSVQLLKSVLRAPDQARHDQAFEDSFGSPEFAQRLHNFLAGKR